MIYEIKDISVVIPTYNRKEDLKITLKNLSKSLKNLNEIIVVDQSKNQETKNLIESLNSKKIRYVFSKTPSITIARNLGVKKSSKDSKIICFIDDDVSIEEDYFKEVLKVFNSNKLVKAVAGYVNIPENEKESQIENMLRRLFFINFKEVNGARILSSYGNTYPSVLNKEINSHWIPGVNMCYLKSVFNEQKFDEALLGYTIAEDIDFSYRLYKKYPLGLIITPKAKLIHRVSNIEREEKKRISYINQVDHFYFQFKNLNNFTHILKFLWSLYGITILRSLNFIFNLNNKSKLKFVYYLESLYYSIINIKKIKKGKVRNF